MSEAVRAWIADLATKLPVQARLLGALVSAVEADPRFDWLELGCSVAEDRGDELSDLDLGLGYLGNPPTEAETGRLLRGLGDVVDIGVQPWEGQRRYWVQYFDGGQLDLVVVPADFRSGRAPGAIALLDRSGRLRDTFVPSVMTARTEEPRQWLLDGWEALANVVKYLVRGSVLEASEQLHRARTRVFQLWAAGEQVDYPAFGLTSLLDVPDPRLPPDIRRTYPRAESADVLAATRILAELLYRAGLHAQPTLDTPLRAYVSGRLTDLADRETP